MASKSSAVAAIFLAMNLLLFTFTSASSCPPKYRKPKETPHPYIPTPTTPTYYYTGKCPIDTLKLGVCVNLLNGLVNAVIGTPPKQPCCTLLEGLADLEVALCLCTVIKASVLGINLNVPLDLSLLVNYCGKKVPTGFQCP